MTTIAEIEELIIQRLQERSDLGGNYAIAFAILRLVGCIEVEVNKADKAQRDAAAELEIQRASMRAFQKSVEAEEQKESDKLS